MLRSIAILTLCLSTVTAQAALLGRAALTPGGTDYQAYYDDVLGITWLADPNYAATETFGVAGIGLGSPGRMVWTTANTWIAAMNSDGYLGVREWRLPSVVDTGSLGCDFGYAGTDCGFNVDSVSSELGHLYYTTLGNIASFNTSGVQQPCLGGPAPYPSYCLSNAGPFSSLLSLQPGQWWSGTEYAPDSSTAWRFYLYDGSQGNDSKGAGYYAWAVTDGDALAVVPIPPAVWLFGSALGVMGWMRRKAM
ncbi:MAG: DUF1566 domain-containing protein [Gammaproteobacteria bacterium]